MYSELPTSGLPLKRAILRWAIVRFTGTKVIALFKDSKEIGDI